MRRRLATLADAPAARLTAAAVVVGATVAAAVVVLSSGSPGVRAGPPRAPVTVTQTLTTRAVLFGDAVEAEIDVVTADGLVDPSSVRIETDPRPFTTTATRVERSSRDGVHVVRTRLTLRCLADECVVPREGGRSFRFTPTVVRFVRGGTELSVTEPWPAVRVSSRLEGANDPLGEGPPAVGTGSRVSPTLARVVLIGLAALLGAVGCWLVVRAIWPRGFLAERRLRKMTELERALAQLDAAAGGEDEETRRRVLEQLATILGDIDLEALERESRTLAWSEAPPDGDELVALGAQVRATVNGSRP